MTPEQAEALGRRWAALPEWAAPGMLVRYDYGDAAGSTAGRITDERHAAYWRPDDGEDVPLPPGAVPDVRDDATRGAMLGKVRAAWGEPTTGIYWDPASAAWVCDIGHGLGFSGASEAEALVAACEAAPNATKGGTT